MTAVVVPVGVGGSGGGVATAINHHGYVVGLAPLAIATLTSFVAGSTKLRGFTVYGDTDAEVWVEDDGVPIHGIKARHSRVDRSYLVLPNPEAYSSPVAVISLRVQNMGATAGAFEGTLMGE